MNISASNAGSANRKLSAGKKPSHCKLRTKCNLRHICNRICREKGDGIVQSRNFLRGESIMRDQMGLVMVIKTGIVVSYYNQDNGERIICATLWPGDTLGETGVFYKGTPIDFILAASDLEVCTMPRDAFRSAVANDLALLTDVLSASADNASNFIRQTWLLQGTKVVDRIERFFAICLLRMYDGRENCLSIPISHETLALIVRAERSNVSRSLKKMEEKGLVTLRTNSILIWPKQWGKSPHFRRQMNAVIDSMSLTDMEVM